MMSNFTRLVKYTPDDMINIEKMISVEVVLFYSHN